MTTTTLTPRERADLAATRGLTDPQRAMLVVLRSEEARRWDCPALAEQLGTSPEGAARTASSLVTRGLAVRWHGGAPRHVYFVAVTP